MPKERVDTKALRRLLDTRTGERAVTAYLNKHPWVLYWTLCGASGHRRYVLPNFPIGPHYKADFAVLNSYSGAFEVKFVELEPIDVLPFTKAGNPTRRLAGAIKQIDDWRAYEDNHPLTVRDTLVRWAPKKDILGYNKGDRPSNFSAQDLADPDTPLLVSYKIILGRSSKQSIEMRRLAGRLPGGHHVELISYDRLLDLAERRYDGKEPRIAFGVVA